MRTLVFARRFLISTVVLAAIAVVTLLPGGSASGGALNLTGVYCMDIWFDITNPARTKGDPHLAGDIISGKIMSRVEPLITPPEDPPAWAVTSVAYTGPGGLIPTGPPSAQSCKVKGDGNELVPEVDYRPVDNDRPNAIATLVDKGSDQNLEWVICQQEDLPSLGLVWVRSVFVLVVDGNPATQDYGLLTAYLNVSAPNNPNDPLDTSCGTTANPFRTTLEATQRVDTTGAPQSGVNDDWDGDGCTDWRELGTNPDTGGLRDPFNPYDLYDVAGAGGGPKDGLVDLANDILGVILHYAPVGGGPYAVAYDRGPSELVGPNYWNMDRPDGVIDLANDILGVILQYLDNCG